MKAMVLAAGRGERLGAETLRTPKPLLRVGNDAPLPRILRGLSAAGFSEVVVNISHLGEQIRTAVGDGGAFGLRVLYSPEESPLETAGGIRLALSRGLLDASSPFVLVNGDIVTDYDFARLRRPLSRKCVLVLTANPPEHPGGDFSLDAGWNLTRNDGGNAMTYAGIGAFSPGMFSGLAAGEHAKLAPLLFAAVEAGDAGFDIHNGKWTDIGRPESLARARAGDG